MTLLHCVLFSGLGTQIALVCSKDCAATMTSRLLSVTEISKGSRNDKEDPNRTSILISYSHRLYELSL